ncbi:nuclear transport factor 2 family protein [Croceivirga thetidis]|uniref:SnoaL-like domain-containing protein n=1 Tax=Croceivirga thetidis TaxID=2721623 RepID=A0ABX1GSV4_9FLAO|nr:nuclear transport factor 2 family protein [Croceivirga thetidis]NKI32699.1 SnoaL-like domain-containing protein [Croceivirga thetidis]
MKRILPFLVCVAFLNQLKAQTNSEIYLFDLTQTESGIELSNKINISKNPGYDNQPSFYDDNTVIFSSTRNNQTDIRKYDIKTGESTWLTDTPVGSEYSPTRIPNSVDISAIRLDTTGFQRLYEYKVKSGKSKMILKEAKVGYHLWMDKDLLVTTVLEGDGMDLKVFNLDNGLTYTFQKGVGRSLGKVPETGNFSYTTTNDNGTRIWSVNAATGQGSGITTFRGSEDYCWLPDKTLITGNGNRLMGYNPSKDNDWRILHNFFDNDIYYISRMAVNPSGTKLAIVSGVSPEGIVQKQLDAYNSRNINAFAATYSDDVKLYNFPNELISEGIDSLRESYKGFFKSTPDLNCKITKRIVTGNKVIDEEYLTMNGQNFSAVAVYEVENGKIAKVTFIR